MDPPWRTASVKSTKSPHLPLTTRFSPEYYTMSNQEIMNLRIDKISRKGFLFLWILSHEINVAYEMMSRWGYEVVDQIIWVKIKDEKVHISQGNHFMHSFEMCLLGYKCPSGESLEYKSRVSKNLIFAEVRKKSQKPEFLYEIINQMMPGSKRIELFARNHNLRSGWFSLGNQLGDECEKWYNMIGCNHCSNSIKIGVKRYKARHQPNYDLCQKCFIELELQKEDFFEMTNSVDEDVLHQYHVCKQCKAEPIWGTRFTCLDCENYDLCEGCFDLNLQSDIKFHDIRHNFHAIEIPVVADGVQTHCNKQYRLPIIKRCFIL